MRLIHEDYHSPTQGRFKDSFIQDSARSRLYVYDSQGSYALIDQAGKVIPQLSISGNEITIAGGNTITLPTQTGSVASVNGKTGTVTITAADITGLAPVAKSGSYNDLTDKPTGNSGGGTTSAPAANTRYERGVSLSGLEFTPNAIPGFINTNYFAPVEADYKYFSAKDLTLVRLPFLWDRAQPYLNGPLDPAFVTLIKNQVQLARNYGMKVILDAHNYGRRFVSFTGGFSDNFTTTSGSWVGGNLNPSGWYESDQNTFFTSYSGGDYRNTGGKYIFQADLTLTASLDGGLNGNQFPSTEVRVFDNGNGTYYRLTFDKYQQRLIWDKTVNGIKTDIAGTAFTINNNTAYTVKADINQGTAGKVTFSVNGTQVAQFDTDSGIAGGKITFYNNFTKSKIDNASLNVNGDTTSGNGAGQYAIGTSTVTTAHFADFWGKMATTFKDVPGIFMYDLMNEPHDMPVDTTPATYNSTSTNTLMSQAAITAIRAVDTTRWICLEGDKYAGLQSFTTLYGANPTVWWNDPSNRTMLSFHYYQDIDHTGFYDTQWSQPLRDRIASDVTPAFDWAKKNGVKIYMGEYGVPNDTTTSGVNFRKDLDTFMTFMDQYSIYGTQWAAGAIYDSASTLNPLNNYTTDRTQMAVIQAHTGTNAPIKITAAQVDGIVTDINGLLTAGTGTTLTGAGTKASPYSVSAALPTLATVATTGSYNDLKNRPVQNTTTSLFRGINSAGAEFAHTAATLPGTYGTDYSYDGAESFNYYAAQGHKVIRLPFRWERIQPTLNGALNTAELNRLITTIGYIKNAGMEAIPDLHNYARYINSQANGGAELQLNVDLPISAFVDVWTKLSTALKSVPGIHGYDIMNEPHDLSQTAGSFTGTVRYDYNDGTVQGWTGDGGTSSNVNNKLRIAGTPGGNGYWNNRKDDSGSNRNPTTGNYLRAKVTLKPGVSGDYNLKLQWQNTSYQWQTANSITIIRNDTNATVQYLVPGVECTVIANFTSNPIVAGRPFAIQYDANNAVGGTEVYIDVDDFSQGSVSGQLTPAQVWETASQQVVTAIRNNSDTTRVYVAGYNYSGAQLWPDTHATPWITDSANNTYYEAHYYFDSNNSGGYGQSYATTNTDAVNRGYANLTARARAELKKYTDWIKTNNVKGLIGEIGWPNTDDFTSWNAVGEALYTDIDAAGLEATYWAGGERWGNGYSLSAYTGSPQAVKKTQTTVLDAHQSTTVTAVSSATASNIGGVKLAGDLGGTANAPTVPGLAAKANTSSLAAVATSGSYNDLINKPTTSTTSGSSSEAGRAVVKSNLYSYTLEDFNTFNGRFVAPSNGSIAFANGAWNVTLPTTANEVNTYRPLWSDILRDFDTVTLDFNFNGSTFQNYSDSPLFILENGGGWKAINLVKWGTNGSSAWQTITVPISKFTSTFDSTPTSAGTGTALLNTDMLYSMRLRIYDGGTNMKLSIRNVRLSDSTKTIVQDFTQPDLLNTAKLGNSQFRFQGIDFMKVTKDNAYSRPTDAKIKQYVDAAKGFNPTHIAVAIPYDTAAAYTINGGNGQTKTSQGAAQEDGSAYALRWAKQVRAAGFRMLWRQMWGDWEGIYSFPFNYVRSPGTAAGVKNGTETDSTLKRTYDYIIANAAQYAPGDLICPTPEPNDIQGVAGGVTDDGGTKRYHFANASDYRKWLRDFITVVNLALDKIGLKGQVGVGFYGISDFLLKGNGDNPKGFLDDRTWDAMTVMGIDTYPNPVTDLSATFTAIEGLYGTSRPLAITEWGTINEGTDAARKAAVDNFYGIFKAKSYAYGISYWTVVADPVGTNANEDLLDKSTLAPIGAYDNLVAQFTGGSAQPGAYIAKAIASSSTSGLATVATTGSYNDLVNKPTIPTVSDASPTVKGIVQLNGDLGGTAGAPTTPTAVHLTGTETITGTKTFQAAQTAFQGNVLISDNVASPTKQYRMRTSGGALDFEGGGADIYFSVWSGAGYTGNQYTGLQLSATGAAATMGLGVNAGSLSTLGGLNYGVAKPTANYTIATNITTVLASSASASITVTLPSGYTSNGRYVIIKRIDTTPANTLTIGSAAGNVEGPLTLQPGEFRVYQANSSTGMWHTVTSNNAADLIHSTATKTAAYTAVFTDEVVYANATGGAFTITLPSTTIAGKELLIKKIDTSANAVTVAGTIDGATNYSLATQNKLVRLMSTATSGTWYVVGNN